MDVAIVGGGICGLSLALNLKQRGIAARVYERAPEIKPLGVGITLLPHAMRVNIAALRAASPPESQMDSLPRYATVARILTGDASATPEDGTDWVASLCRDLEIQPLRAFGVREADVPELVEKSARASSMRANPMVLTREQLKELLSSAL